MLLEVTETAWPIVKSVLGLALLWGLKVVSNFINTKIKEVQNHVQHDKISNITSMVNDIIRDEVERRMIIIREQYKAGLFTDKDSGPGSLSKALGECAEDSARGVKDIVSVRVVSYLVSENIEDFDKWVASRVDFYITEQKLQLLSESFN